MPFDPQTPFAPPLDVNNYIPQQTTEDSAPITPIDLTPFFGDPDTNDEVTITVELNSLPDGLSFDPLTNTIFGTPASDASQSGDLGTPGTYTIPVAATDQSGETFTTNITFVISNPPPTVTTAIEDFTETVGNEFETETADNFEDIDGDDLTFTANGLPLGLEIDPVTGVISGQLDPSAVVDAPNEGGVYIVTVTVDDGQGGTVSTSFYFTAIDAFVPVVDEAEEEISTDDNVPIEPEASVPFILQALDNLDKQREKREKLEQTLFDVDENNLPKDAYKGGHESIETIAGNTIIRTLVTQDRIYLEVRPIQGLSGWEIVTVDGDKAANWEAYENANMFVSHQGSADGDAEVVLRNKELGLEVHIRINMNTGSFDVLDKKSIEEDEGQVSLNGFSRQLQALSDHHTVEARNLVQSIG